MRPMPEKPIVIQMSVSGVAAGGTLNDARDVTALVRSLNAVDEERLEVFWNDRLGACARDFARFVASQGEFWVPDDEEEKRKREVGELLTRQTERIMALQDRIHKVTNENLELHETLRSYQASLAAIRDNAALKLATKPYRPEPEKEDDWEEDE